MKLLLYSVCANMLGLQTVCRAGVTSDQGDDEVNTIYRCSARMRGPLPSIDIIVRNDNTDTPSWAFIPFGHFVTLLLLNYFTS